MYFPASREMKLFITKQKANTDIWPLHSDSTFFIHQNYETIYTSGYTLILHQTQAAILLCNLQTKKMFWELEYTMQQLRE
jgi:hypothetical protein